MSWCGGGEISMTPGVACLSLAIISVTLNPGSCPPSPGLAPCTTLISISRHWFKYSAVTPKCPEATCLIAEFSLSQFWRGVKRAGFSPPSPESDLAPLQFISIFSVQCPSDDSPLVVLPGVHKRLRIAVVD